MYSDLYTEMNKTLKNYAIDYFGDKLKKDKVLYVYRIYKCMISFEEFWKYKDNELEDICNYIIKVYELYYNKTLENLVLTFAGYLQDYSLNQVLNIKEEEFLKTSDLFKDYIV